MARRGTRARDQAGAKVEPRLCMVVHGSYPIGEPRVAREAAEAVRDGWSVDVIACAREGEARTEVVDGVHVLRLSVTHRRGASLGPMMWEYISFTILAATRLTRAHGRSRYDVIQVHNPPDFLIFAALLPKLTGARIVLDVHDLSPDMFEMRFGAGAPARLADRVLQKIERLACAVADHIVTVHEPYRRELVKRGVPADKISVVMNSLDERQLPRCAAPRLAGSRIVYHGTLTPHYGVSLLCEAFAQAADTFPDATLEVYGEGDALQDIRRRVAELGLGERVWLSGGYMPHREVLEAVAGAAVGVIPNLPTRLNRFALSSKLLEYVALGIPVVSADLETIAAHFSGAEVRFFRAGDVDELALALRDALEDRAESMVRAERARDRYQRNYRWSLQARRYLDAIGSTIQVSPNVMDDEARGRDTSVSVVN